MEEAKAYIESGILELYVLGQLSAPESNEVEEMANKYSEVKAEILAIELVMENYAQHNSIVPSAKLESQLFDTLGLKNTEQTIAEPKIVS